MVTRWHGVAGAAGLLLWAACAGSGSGDFVTVRACAPGAQVECACGANVKGYQVCGPTGDSYDPCICPDGASQGGGSAGGMGGIGGVAAAGGIGGAGAVSGAGGIAGIGGISAGGGTGGLAGAGGSAGTGAAGSTGGVGGLAGSAGAAGTGAAGGTGGAGGLAGSAGAAGTGGSGGAGAMVDSGPDTAGAGGAGGPDASVDASVDAEPDAEDGAIAYDGPTTCDPLNVTNIVNRTCDLIVQDCPSGQTCGPHMGDGGTCETACLLVGQGTVARGAECTSHSQCSPGLRCADYHCTRPCCVGAQDYLCGPNGKCDMQIPFCGGTAYMYECRFPKFCEPWSSGCSGLMSACHLEYDGFACAVTDAVDAGASADNPCTYASDCGDAQVCLVSGDAGAAVCRWFCKLSDSGAPDAGTVGGAPGAGGCPGGQTCKPWGQPTMPWLGYCEP